MSIDDGRLASLDTAGVALAAIQGLAERLDDENATLREELDAKDDRIDALEAENDQLRERLSSMEERLTTIEADRPAPAATGD